MREKAEKIEKGLKRFHKRHDRFLKSDESLAALIGERLIKFEDATDPWGNEKVGFSASGKIDRQDFGLTWSKALETGGLVVGNDVKIFLEIEGNKKK